jgi:hypothetical protein
MHTGDIIASGEELGDGAQLVYCQKAHLHAKAEEVGIAVHVIERF